MYMNKLKNNESGIISILVTIVMMLVLTLLVLGLSQLGVSEQKNALKRQLSTTAYYLAESGVNKQINSQSANSTGCNSSISVDSTLTYSIPCTTVTSTTTNFIYGLSKYQAKVLQINSANPLKTLSFSWTNSSTSPITNCPSSKTNQFKPAAQWTCGDAVMFVSIVAADNFNSSTLFSEGSANGYYNFYLVPTNTSGSTNYPASTTSINDLVTSYCSSSGSATTCNRTLDLSAITTHNYYVRIVPLYTSATVTISATDSLGAVKSNQVEIDSTGRAGNLLQRLVARVTKSTSTNTIFANQSIDYQTPIFAVQSINTICKRFEGYYNSSTDNYLNIDTTSLIENCTL
jgi:Tfp pilus assembly protein PilX